MSTSTLPGSARLKLALVPVLGAVFFAQLWPRGEAPSPPAAPAAVADTTSLANPATPSPQASTPPQGSWPRADLAMVLQHNPFAVPSVLKPPPPPAAEIPDRPLTVSVEEEIEAPNATTSIVEPSAENRALKVVQLESKRVSVVLVSPQGASAVVDSKVYRVNDYLEPGVQIAEIRPDAVILHVHESRPSAKLQELPK